MGKLIKIIILETVVLVVLMVLLLLPKQKSGAEVCFEQHCFQVEVAKNLSEQQKGLMFRDSMGKDKGMLFVFEREGNYPFWMKNTLILLDIIWINQDKEIVFIKESVQPCVESCEPIDPKQNAKYVLELNGGVASQIGVKIGEKITINQ